MQATTARTGIWCNFRLRDWIRSGKRNCTICWCESYACTSGSASKKAKSTRYCSSFFAGIPQFLTLALRCCMQMIAEEAQRYRALGAVLVQRVEFVTQEVEHVKLHPRKESSSFEDPSKSKSEASHHLSSLATAQQELEKLRTASSKDHLVTEAQLCQLCWRVQEQVATGHRIDALIHTLAGDIQTAEAYLGILKTKDRSLYDAGASPNGARGDMNAVMSESVDQQRDGDSFCGQHLRAYLPFVLLVFEYYSRQQWATQSLEKTTTLGAKIQSVKDQVASLSHSSGSGVDAADEDTDELRGSLRDDLGNAELELLLNRFECRAAEHTSEAMRDRVERLAAATTKTSPTSISASMSALVPPSDLHFVATSVLSLETLNGWLFSSDLCHFERSHVLDLLRRTTTNADPRDAAGNISEVIYGASLNSKEIRQIYLVHSKHKVNEQWNVSLVILFFARLFRRAALQVRSHIIFSRISRLLR